MDNWKWAAEMSRPKLCQASPWSEELADLLGNVSIRGRVGFCAASTIRLLPFCDPLATSTKLTECALTICEHFSLAEPVAVDEARGMIRQLRPLLCRGDPDLGDWAVIAAHHGLASVFDLLTAKVECDDMAVGDSAYSGDYAVGRKDEMEWQRRFIARLTALTPAEKYPNLGHAVNVRELLKEVPFDAVLTGGR